MLDPSDFEANPLAGAPVAAQITGTGATLEPDAAATGTGTVGSHQTHDAGVARHHCRRSDHGQRWHQYDDLHGGHRAPTRSATLISAINGGADGNAEVTASLSGSGNLVLTGTNDIAIDHGRRHRQRAADARLRRRQQLVRADQSVDAERGGAGQTLTVTVGSGTPQTITFGTGAVRSRPWRNCRPRSGPDRRDRHGEHSQRRYHADGDQSDRRASPSAAPRRRRNSASRT